MTVVILSCLHSSVPTQHFNGFLLYLNPPPPRKKPQKIMVLHFSVLTRISTISIPLFHNTCSAKFHFLFFSFFFGISYNFIQGKEVLNLHLNKASETHVSETHCICHYVHNCLHMYYNFLKAISELGRLSVFYNIIFLLLTTDHENDWLCNE